MLGRSAWSALGAGLLTALAVLVRTNLAPLTGVCWLWLAYGAWRAAGDARLTRLKQLAAYTLGVLPGPIVVAMLNAFWYGSPFRSGYGPLANLYELGRVPHVRTPVRLSRSRIAVRSVAPRLGAHTTEILEALGYSPGEVDALRRDRVI